MKRIFTLIALLGLAALAISQTVTNTGLDVILDTNVDNSLRTSWKVDENLRTNGIAPYTNIVSAITYKTFLALQMGNAGGVVDAAVAQQEEIQLFQQIRALRTSDPNTYRKIFRIAYGLPN